MGDLSRSRRQQKTNETLILKGIKFRGTKTKGHEYKHIEDAWDEGSPNTLKK